MCGALVCSFRGIFRFCTVTHAERESMVSRRIAAGGMAPCVTGSSATIRAMAMGLHPAASASFGNVQRSQKPQAQDPTVQGTRRTPGEIHAMVGTRVRRCEAASAVLGEDDGEELATLQGCLRRAKVQAQVRPVEKRIADCSQFLARAKKRAEAGEAALQKAADFKRFCDEEVAVAERRFEDLQREVARQKVNRWPVDRMVPLSSGVGGKILCLHCDEGMQEMDVGA